MSRRNRTAVIPGGGDAATNFFRQTQQVAQDELLPFDTSTVKARAMTRGFRMKSTPPIPGSRGMKLASPMEYDMETSYGGQIWVHVGAANEAVTAGTIDPDSGQQVFSAPGWYCSASSGVPIENVGGNQAYHIPQVPLPDPNDIDDPKNYWVIFLPDVQCA